MDIFEDIKNFEGHYQINKNGEIYSVKRKIIMKQQQDKDNYFRIKLSKNNKKQFPHIHRLLAIQFIPNPNNYPLVDHIDKNKQNNKLNNLRWIDYSGNSRNIERKTKLGLPTGVYISKKKYAVNIRKNGKLTYIGSYNTIEEASKSYQNEYKKLMSKFGD